MRNISVAICCGLLLGGCSSFAERHQASGNFEYLEEKQQAPLVAPQGYSPIKLNHQYDIPELGPEANISLVGTKLDIRSPALPMAVAPDTLVADNGERVEIIFESFKNAEQFESDLWQKLTSFVAAKDYGVSLSRQGHSLTTRSIDSDPYFKLAFGLEDEQTLIQQYQFDLNVEPQGHKATVGVELVKHQQQNGDVELNKLAKRRYETRMINLLLSHVNQQAKLAKLESKQLSTKGMAMELGFDNEQNSAFIINSTFEQVWEKLARVLPKLGFEVDDRDKTLGTYFVRFDETDTGFWSSLFGDNDVSPLDLAQENYQVKLGKSGGQSILTIIDKAGDNLSAEQMSAMSNTFKAILAKKQL